MKLVIIRIVLLEQTIEFNINFQNHNINQYFNMFCKLKNAKCNGNC